MRRPRAMAMAVAGGAFAVVVLAASAAAGQETIRVRGGDHDGYGRLVFDWPEPVRYRASIADGQLRLEFARRATFRLEPAFPALDSYLGQGAPGPHGYRLTFPLKGSYDLEHWTSGPKVVIDLKDLETAEPQAPEVRLRVGEHDDFDRLVFDWPAPVDYELARSGDGGRVTVRFERPARLDVDAYAKDPPPRIRDVEVAQAASGSAVDIAVPAEADLRHFAYEGKVVVDVRTGEGPRNADAAPATAEAARAGAPAGEQAASATPAAAPDSRPKTKPEPGGGSRDRRAATADAAATDDEAGDEADGVAAPLQLLPKAKKVVARARDNDVGAGRDDGGAAATPGREAGTGAKAVAEEAGVEEAGMGEAGARRFPPQKVARGLAPRPGEVPPRIDSVRLELPWAGERLAVYRRGGALWVLAEGAPPKDIEARLAGREAVRGAEARALDGLTLLRLEVRPGLQAHPVRREQGWRLALAAQPALPPSPLAAEPQAGHLRIPVETAGPVVDVEDPGTGGRLFVAPLAEAGRGMPLHREFPEFTLTATRLGVAVAPKAEHVRVRAVDGQVIVDGGRRRLAVTRTDRDARPARRGAGEVDGRALLDLAAWRRGDGAYSQARRRLQQAVVDAPPARKHLARLDLARFYFAHGLAAETLGALEVYAQSKARRKADPQVRLIAGAAHLLAGDWRAAGRALAHPALDGIADALPWRAAYAAATGASRAAVAAFHRAEGQLAGYPPSVRRRMHLWIAEARLRIGEIDAAAHNLDKARELASNEADEAQVDDLQARKLLAEDDVEAAETLWREVAASGHGSSAARARFVMTERALAAGRIDREEAIARLERLRFAWRGDAFEAVLLQRLADLFVAGDEYRRALTALRQIASHLPESAWAEGAADRMRRIFKDVFLSDAADRLPPLKALALYESFRELTPAGPDGNRMIGRLVDRLVRVDLLGRAAELLDGQVRHRLAGAAKARAGARLASVYLLDRQPAKALEALEISDAGDEGARDLLRRRRHLRARALTRLERGEEALALLAGDRSDDGRRLKADIHAEAGRWPEAAEALKALLPEAPGPEDTLEPGESRQVLRSAVALTLAGRRDELDTLEARYGAAMKESAHAETFRLLAGDDADDDSVATIAQRLAQVTEAKAFMNAFRDTLQQQANLDVEE